MSDDLIRERWARYVGGESLSENERRELLEGLRRNPALRDELLGDVQMHRLIRSLGRMEQDGDMFLESFEKFMANERDGSRFIRVVDSRIKQGAAPTPRPRHRAPRREGPSPGSPWVLALVAAGLFAAALAFVAGPSPAPTSDPRSAAERRRRLDDERRAAEAQRRAAEERKAAIERREQQLAQPPTAPAADPKAEEQRKMEREQLAKQREEAEQALRDAIARARKVDEELRAPEKPPTPPVAPPPQPPNPVVPETLAELARLGKTEGEAFVVNDGGRTPAATGLALRAGDGLETGGARGALEFVYPDQSRVELGAGTQVRDLKIEGGKGFRIAKGDVRIVAQKQPNGQPMVLESPHGTYTVVGTTLRLIVDAGSTRLEVTEGKVQLRNLANKTVDVVTGHYAVAASGTEPVAKSLVPDTLALALLAAKGAIGINFGPAGIVHPDGFLGDSGQLFDAKRGYGWKEPITRVHNQMDGPRPQMSRMTAAAPVVKDPLRDTYLAVGWKDIPQTWTLTVPNGRYLVTVCAGSNTYQQGPHHVWVEGVQAIDNVITRTGEFVERTVRVEVKDFELTMRVGGGGKDFDGTSDAMLCFLVVRKAER